MAGLGTSPQHWRSRQRRWLLERVLTYDQALITLVNDGNGGFWLPMREVAGTVAKNYAYTAEPGSEILADPEFSTGTGWTPTETDPDSNAEVVGGKGIVETLSGSTLARLTGLSSQTVGDTYEAEYKVDDVDVVSTSPVFFANNTNLQIPIPSPGVHRARWIFALNHGISFFAINQGARAEVDYCRVHKIGEMDALIAATTGVRRAGLRGKAQTEGPEALTNGSFEAGSTGWLTLGTNGTTRTVTFENGQCTIVNDGGSQLSVYQTSLIAGQRYRLTIVVSSLTAPSVRIQSTSPAGLVYDNISTPGTYVYEVTSPTTGIVISLISSTPGTGTAVIDSISMIPIMGGQVVVNPSFDDGSTGWTSFGTNGTTRTVTFAGGQCTIISDGAATSCGAFQTAVLPGQTYRISLDVASVSGTLQLHDGSAMVYRSITSAGVHVFDIVATTNALTLRYSIGGGGGAAVINSIEAMPYPGADAFYFDKVNSILTVTNRASLQAMEEFTVAMVLYPFDAGENNVGRLFRKADEFDFLFASSSRNIRAIVDCATTDGDVTTSTTVPALAWSSVIITYSHSGDKTPHVYINGVEASYSSTQASSGNRISNSNNIVIGNAETLAATLSGVVDEALLVKRALSAAEIAQLHTQLTGAVPGQSVAA